MNEQIKNHFKRSDPILYELIIKLGSEADVIEPTISHNYFSDLCEAIVNQQLSEKAGKTIYSRFLDLFPDRQPTSLLVSTISDQTLRSVGMSWSKVKYIKSLATSFTNRQIDFDHLYLLPDDEVLTSLITLHGIGRWSAEMFLMFSLAREDIFSFGDMGLRRAIMVAYAFKKTPTVRQIEKIIRTWTPYKTYACRILWQSLDRKILT